MDNNNLSKSIRNIRLKKGFTQKELSERAGIEYAMLNKYEKGKATPNPKTLQKIAAALGCTVGQLYGEIVGYIGFDELRACAQPLIELLQKKGNPMTIVQVTDEGADMYIAQCGTEKRPRLD